MSDSSGSPATRRSSRTTPGSTSAFLDREVERFAGQRIASPVVDTVWLARRLLGERTRRVGLASLAHFFGVPTAPCHRALPDARATAEILLVLLGLAQERGARTVADVVELAAPRARRLNVKRALVAGRAAAPGAYVFRGAGGLCSTSVGPATCARGCGRTSAAAASGRRSRRRSPRSSGSSGRRPARSSRRRCWSSGSYASSGHRRTRAGTRPDRHLYLHRRGSRWRASEEPSPHGPLLEPRGRAGRTGTRRLQGGRSRGGARAAQGEAPAARRGAALRGRGAAARPDHGARGGRRRARRARAPARARAVPRRPCARAGLRPRLRRRRRPRRGAAPRPRAAGRRTRRRHSSPARRPPSVAARRTTPTSCASSARSSAARRPSSASSRSSLVRARGSRG